VTLRLASLLTLVPAVAFAHPGHGTTEPDGWAHYLTDPVHVTVLGGATLGVVLLARSWRRAARRRSRS
jgi:hypothetical protein